MNDELKTLASLSDLKQELSALAVGACLSNDDILGFVQGYLKDERLEAVHAHVDTCEVCQRLVAEAAHAMDAEPILESAHPSWNTVFKPNTLVDKRYSILRLIARGGMGEVYEAQDTALQERVALKTVTSTACDSALAIRYLKAEVQLARRISHPNVCRIYDFGTHEMQPAGGEVHFLVMEFVEGQCLGKRLRQFGALPLELTQSIAHQLLLGLRAAHQAGILHRDFKSDNVMLRSESNGRVTPVILDFGLAKALNESGNIATTQNQSQGMVGTIGYMAPEQIEGEPLSKASDLYAFGVVWFEMLTGRLPFEGESPVAAAMARLHREPVAPSSLNPEVPKWLDDVVARCLRRSRTDRFASAEQVLEAIASKSLAPVASASSGVSSSATSSTPSPSLAPQWLKGPAWLSKRRWARVTVLGVIGVAIGTLAMQRHREPPRSLDLPVKSDAAPLGSQGSQGLPTALPAHVGASQLQIQQVQVQPVQGATAVPATIPATIEAGGPATLQQYGSEPRLVARDGKTKPSKLRGAKLTMAVASADKQQSGAGNASAASVASDPVRAASEPEPTPAKGKLPDWLPIWTKKSDSKTQPVAD